MTTYIDRIMALAAELERVASRGAIVMPDCAASWSRQLAAIAADMEQAELEALTDDLFGPDPEAAYYAQD